MAKKIGDFAKAENPLGGNTIDLLNPLSWIKGIMFVIFAIIVFATGQSIVKKVGNKIPMVDTTIEPLAQRQVQKETGLRKV